MHCLKPLKIPLSDDQRAERAKNECLPYDYRFATFQVVPCGKCEACLSNRRNQWSFRLKQENRFSESSYFLTLTYDDEHLPKKGFVSKRDVQTFLKRLRKRIEPFKIRYYLISEYGPQTFRPHYHAILFDFPLTLKNKLDDILNKSWNNGFIRVDPVNDARIHYVTSYMCDKSSIPKELAPNFMLCSKRPAIGYSFLSTPNINDYLECCPDGMWKVRNTDGTISSIKLPRYYLDKLLSDEQRVQCTIEAINAHNAKDSELRKKHIIWLKEHGYEINDVSLVTPFVGSPLELELQAQKRFAEKVRSRFKNKQDL